MTEVEAQARAMPQAEPRTYLRTHSWTRLSRHGSEAWLHLSHNGWRDPATGDRTHYTLAAAIRTALAEECRYPLDREVLDTHRG